MTDMHKAVARIQQAIAKKEKSPDERHKEEDYEKPKK
jgi:hypothetical protein